MDTGEILEANIDFSLNDILASLVYQHDALAVIQGLRSVLSEQAKLYLESAEDLNYDVLLKEGFELKANRYKSAAMGLVVIAEIYQTALGLGE